MVKLKRLTLVLFAGLVLIGVTAFAGGCNLGEDDAGGGRSRNGNTFQDDFGGSSISREVPSREVSSQEVD